MTLTQINKAGLHEIALDHVFTIGASGSSAYTFQGEGLNGTVNNPTLYLTRGKTYRFENGSGGHPIRIQSTSGASGTAYNTGVTNNAGSGTVIVEVQHDAPDVLYYQCTSHAAMNGILYITGALVDGGVTTAKLADDAVTDAKLANSINSAIAANTAKTSNATHTGDVTGSTSLTIANDAVTSDKIADNAITADHIANSAINDQNMVTGAVINANNLFDSAVTTAKIADQAVTLDKLPHGTSSNDGKFLRANNGADPTFETVTGTTINNNADNRIITGSGTANTLNGESNVTIDSSARMTISSTAHGDALTISSGGTTYGGSLHLTGTGSPNQDYVIAVGGGDNAYISGRGLLIRDITNSANRIGILTNGNLQIHDGDLKVASGHGIDFSATGQSSGMSNELFDDYEEGTWTPSYYPQSSAMTLNYNLRTGTYVKIGRVVYWQFRMRLSSASGNGNQALGFAGLPYTIDSSQPQCSGAFFGESWSGEIPNAQLYHGNTTRGELYYYTSAGKYNVIYASDMNYSNSYLIGAGFYFAA